MLCSALVAAFRFCRAVSVLHESRPPTSLALPALLNKLARLYLSARTDNVLDHLILLRKSVPPKNLHSPGRVGKLERRPQLSAHQRTHNGHGRHFGVLDDVFDSETRMAGNADEGDHLCQASETGSHSHLAEKRNKYSRWRYRQGTRAPLWIGLRLRLSLTTYPHIPMPRSKARAVSSVSSALHFGRIWWQRPLD